MEYIGVLDCNGQPTGRSFVRGSGAVLGKGEYVGAVTICIFNKEGKLLIQQRAADKASWPGLWDISVGGAMTAGESPQVSAMREVQEELGLTVDLEGVRPSLVTTFSNGFTYTFIVHMDVKLEDLVLQKEEVQAADFADLPKVLKMIEDESFIWYRKSWVEYLFDVAEKEFIF